MKKVLLFIAILFFFDRFGQAQSLTIEYNIGHGSYQMSDMKDILKNQMLPVTNVQVTDNFPGYVTQDARVGVEWRRHHVGVLFNYMNTAGKNGVTDYSGSCDYELRNKGYKLGAFYHFCLVKEKVSIFTFEPYVGLSTGFVLNKVNEINRLFVESDPEVGYRKDNTFSGRNFCRLLPIIADSRAGCKPPLQIFRYSSVIFRNSSSEITGTPSSRAFRFLEELDVVSLLIR